MGEASDQLVAIMPEPAGDRAPGNQHHTRIAIFVCLVFGFGIPILRAPGYTGFLGYAFGLTPIVAWG